jgi:acyl carrier protein
VATKSLPQRRKGGFKMEQIDIIRDFLIKDILPDTDKIDLGFEDSLIETGIIDSLAIVKIIAFLEDEFKIKVYDEDILPENFESINAMNLFVDAKKQD